MTIEEWLGEDNILGIDIWRNKYRENDESFDEWLDRVSGGDYELKMLILEQKFLFGGRTLSNRGTNKKGSFSNCYSRGFVEDNLEDLMQANTDIAKTFKAQGGQGISLSKIRPRGCDINNGQFKSDGIIPFMEIYNRTTQSISQGGSRKGALIMSLDIWHKEAEDFIKIKSENAERINKANLSLEIDDDFMECVRQYYAHGIERVVKVEKEYEGNKIEYEVTPIKLYKLMMQKAYDWAEPGCIFTDRFRNYNLMQFCDDYQIETCNPCFHGNTQILTNHGYRAIAELVGKETIIWNGEEWSAVEPRVTAENQPCLRISFSNGHELIVTNYHKFILQNNKRVEAQNLQVGDKLKKWTLPIIEGELVLNDAYKYGFFCGDGAHYSDGRNRIPLYGEKRDLFNSQTVTECPKDWDKNFVPNTKYTIESRKNFLSGLIDADGTVNSKEGSIAISSVNKPFLEKVQFMIETLGAKSTLSLNKQASKKLLPDGKGGKKEYNCQNLYRLLISAYYVEQLQLPLRRVKANPNTNRNAERFIQVVNIEPYGVEEKVYCFTEPLNHSVVANGVLTAQCGEQPLPKHGACNLGSLNLSKFVKYPFEKAAYFDFKDFRRAVRIAVEALDTVVDENVKNHPLKEQAEMAKNYRNIGLGIMGLHDMLIKMGYTYGSGHSLNIIQDIMYTMFNEAVKTSAFLAAKKGVFPAYNENILKSEILISRVEEETLELVEKYGLRNCSLISIAPTGSIGSLLDVSTGCEPFYDFSYIRKTESLNGEEPKYYKVDSGIVKEYRKVTKTKDEPLPEYFITASQIHWKDRIAIQSIMQNYVDTAISSTINLPKETTLAEIEALYLEAWLSGLKGVTIYRDGCKREGILSKDKKKKTNSNKSKNTLERGYVVPSNDNVIGLKKTLKTGCGTLHCKVFFDADTNDLTEIYLSKGSTGGCNNFMVGLSRMISMSARAGVSVVDIVDQLMSAGTCPSYYVRKKTKKDTSKGSSCPVAVGYAIKELWEEFQGKELKPKDIEEEKIQEGNNEKPRCPQCGALVIFEGGCNTCRSCGWSKCE